MPTECFVTYQPFAVTSPSLPRSGAQLLDHGGDAVRDVVVAGPAEVRQAARDRQRPRVAGRDAKHVARDLHRRRKAAVEIEVRDVVDA